MSLCLEKHFTIVRCIPCQSKIHSKLEYRILNCMKRVKKKGPKKLVSTLDDSLRVAPASSNNFAFVVLIPIHIKDRKHWYSSYHSTNWQLCKIHYE